MLPFVLLALAADPDPVSPPSLPTWGTTHPVTVDVTEGTWMHLSVAPDRIVFDLLGDIWSIPLAGGTATRLSSGPAWDGDPKVSPDGRQIAYSSDQNGNENLWVMDLDGKNPKLITREKDARVTSPVWDPTGPWLVGRRRTVDTRSTGVTELWQYHLGSGTGFALTSKDEQPHAGEATVTPDYLWYSTRAGRFDYNNNPIAGLWQIQRKDRHNNEERTVVAGVGSAARPLIHPDGRRVVFVARHRTRTALEVLDLDTGSRRDLGEWLDHDQMEGLAARGVYPAMDWLDGETFVVWAGGKIWKVKLADGSRTEIPFRVTGTWDVHEVARPARSVPDEVQARVLRWVEESSTGRIAFSAMGQLYLQEPGGTPSLFSAGTGYSPAFSPDGSRLAWTSWTDPAKGEAGGGRLHLSTLGKKPKTVELPVRGQLVNPAFSEDGTELVVLRGFGGSTSPDLGAEPWFELIHLWMEGKEWRSRVVTSVNNRGSAARAPRLTLRGGRVWYLVDHSPNPREPEETTLISIRLDGTDRKEHLLFPNGADEVVLHPDGRTVAYRSEHQARLTQLPTGLQLLNVGEGVPSLRLTDTVGDWLSWVPAPPPAKGKSATPSYRLSWMEGPTRSVLDVGQIDWSIADDAPRPAAQTTTELKVVKPRARPSGKLALTHARVLTLAKPAATDPGAVIEDATVLIDGDRIVSITPGAAPPADATVIDCTGKTIIPGLIDVHAHLHYDSADILPEQPWRYQASLDYGVTTVHDPSASTDLVFTQAERVEAGLMVGPRITSTGFILYGALNNSGANTPTLDAARGHLRRLQQSGAFSAKIYQQSQRDRRMWYAQACAELGMLCVTEGGGDLAQNLNFAVDGFAANEHAIPNAPLYADVEALLAGSRHGTTLGMAYTPTLLVAYGGLFGENYFFQKYDVLADSRLRRHTPAADLEARAFRLPMSVRDDDWFHQTVAVEAAQLSRQGVLVTLGAHGQLQGLGVHWELWALAGPGAMSPYEALLAGTIQGARYLGLDREIGTLEPGKLADMIVLDANPLDAIHNSTRIHRVIKNGELVPTDEAAPDREISPAN